MNEKETVDISRIKMSSTVFPTKEDMKLWESLTHEQRKAVELRDEKEGFRSGVAAKQLTMPELIAEAKAELNGG